MDLGLKDATAVVVGGGRGMGFAAARCLAEDGARVALVGRTKAVLERAANDLTGRGSPDAVGLVADTTDADASAARVRRVERSLGRRAQCAHQRGRSGQSRHVRSLTDAQWRAAFDDGVMGMVHCVRSALPLLRKAQWARIVNFSAHSTQRQTVILPAYTAAKAALTSISKNLSAAGQGRDHGQRRLTGQHRVRSADSWAESVGVDGNDPYALMAAIDKHFGHPAHLPRAGRPEEIGPVVAFLASKRNSYMTGANINVDGGSDFT